MTSEPSGRLYSAITKHWPKIAAGLVVMLGLVELILGGLTADSGLEFYLMAWAATTGGLWFLFEKAERAVSDETRTSLGQRLGDIDQTVRLRSIPDHFATLFDTLFGERHWSEKCFIRSMIASTVTVGVISIGLRPPGFTGAALLGTPLAAALIAAIPALGFGAVSHRVPFLRGLPTAGTHAVQLALFGASHVFLLFGPDAVRSFVRTGPEPWGAFKAWLGILFVAQLFNWLPDYVSLLQTRWAIGWMRHTRLDLDGSSRYWLSTRCSLR